MKDKLIKLFQDDSDNRLSGEAFYTPEGLADEVLNSIKEVENQPIDKRLTHPTIDIEFYEWLGKIWNDIRPGLTPKDYLMQGFQAGRTTLKEGQL